MPQVNKGDRVYTAMRVHPDLYGRIDSDAKRLGTSKSDYLAHLIATQLSMPNCDPLQKQQLDEPLDMTA